ESFSISNAPDPAANGCYTFDPNFITPQSPFGAHVHENGDFYVWEAESAVMESISSSFLAFSDDIIADFTLGEPIQFTYPVTWDNGMIQTLGCSPEWVIVDGDTDDDGVCDADEIPGCQDATACNYDMSATDAGECIYVTEECDFCSGETDGTGVVVNGDANANGACDVEEGCTYPNACNYDPTVTFENGSCTFSGCTDPNAINYDAAASCDDGSCIIVEDVTDDCTLWDENLQMFVQDPACAVASSCFGDGNGDGEVNAADLLSFLGIFGTTCNE
ncbi:MAG: hypothetical protein AAF193_07355, partial [Bacteroidota bacterium]